MAINKPHKKIEWDDSWNNFSFWFPKIENCGIKVPTSIIIPAPDKEYYMHCYMEQSEEDMAYFYAFAKDTVIPKMHGAGISLPFIKNATFSNKFNAATCMPVPGAMEIAVAIANINYEALCVGAEGLSEIIVRERIKSDRRKTPTIYNGLPLRPEFRVFYDFESHSPMYTANYWDYDYVYPHLHDATDKLVFDSQHAYIDEIFSQRKSEIQALVVKSMKNVQGLCGQWSVDVMLDDNGDPWLIDMAVAQCSAYWHELEEAKKKSGKAWEEAEERYRSFSADNLLIENQPKGEMKG